MKIDIYDANHPLRKIAGEIIDTIIEPIVNRGHCIKGERYYKLEDEITLLLSMYLKMEKEWGFMSGKTKNKAVKK